MLRIENLDAGLDGKAVFKGRTFFVSAGEVHATMGQNGAGKPTRAFSPGEC